MGFTQQRVHKSAKISLILASVLVGTITFSVPKMAHAVGGRRPQPPVKLPDPPKVLGKYGPLRVMSYNIQGLPVFSTGGRLRDIGEQFRKMRAEGKAPHIVCIQEAFHAETEELIELSGYPYRAYGPGPLWPKAGSGLLILSEFPLKNIVTMVFREENSTGFDWNSRKGVVKAEVRITTDLGDYQFNIFNTHVQADYFNDFMPLSETIKARRRQFMELASFIQRHNSSGGSYLLVGDFNTYAIREDYFDLPQMLSVRDAAEDCGVGQNQCVAYVDAIRDMKNSVDHIFYKGGRATQASAGAALVDEPAKNIEQWQPVYYQKSFRDAVNGRQLSDHLALDVHFTW